MIQARYIEFLKRIAKESSLEEKEIDRRVKQKQATLGGLVTLEGAALIVASELGVRFDKQKAKIAELMVGMRNMNVIGKIVKIFPLRRYTQRSGSEGKVASFLLADETASVRAVLWDTAHISLLEDEKLKQEDVIEIKNADVRGADIKELHLSGKSAIARSDERIENVKISFTLSSSKISDLVEGDRVSVRATIAQIFPLRFFPACPECRSRLAEDGEKFYCSKHGEVMPKFMPILSFYIDDGSANIRAVCFLDALVKLLDVSEEQILNLKAEAGNETADLKDKLLGEEFFFEGRVRKNALFDRQEFIVNSASRIDVDRLIEELSKEIEFSS